MGCGEIHRDREEHVNHTTFPAQGTWYSRYAALYLQAPKPTVEPEPATVTELPALPRLTPAA